MKVTADIIGVSAALEQDGSAVERAVGGPGRKIHGDPCDFVDPAAFFRSSAMAHAATILDQANFPTVQLEKGD